MKIANVFSLEDILEDLAATETASNQKKRAWIFHTRDSRGVTWLYSIRAKSDTVAKLQEHLERYRRRVSDQRRLMSRGLHDDAGMDEMLREYKTEELIIHESLSRRFRLVSEAQARHLLKRRDAWIP